ncbi:MAG: serine/threonine-protein kinase [Enhygromyxa sp.]
MSLEGLQRYQIMEPLGSGSQGHTFRAIDRVTKGEVAVKVLSLRQAAEWKAFELFEREAEVLAGLRHFGIPRYRDYFASEESGDYFLVMDLVEGRPLSEELGKPGSFDEARLRALMLGILDILEYLHSRTPPVIHRDIKPANVIVDGQGRVHLVDFGGVRVAAQVGGGSTVIGTFGYMAPEQLHGDAGPAVDLYALGATIVALATGKPADELPHVGLAIDLDALTLPDSLRAVLARLLEPDPRNRASSVAEVRELLDGRARARAQDHARAEPSAALAIPGVVRGLARTPKPMSILVWIFALMTAAGLIVIEYAILPIVYLFLRAFADNKRNKGEAVDEDEARITSLREFRSNTTRQRELAAYVVRETSPLRDEERPALPPGESER